jgi:hypothetical protein
MKILLTDPSVEPGPTTLLVWHGDHDEHLKTIAGEPVDTGFVAECGWSAVHKAVDQVWDGIDGGRTFWAEQAIYDLVRSTARPLLGVENGSPIGVGEEWGVHYVLDFSKAIFIDHFPDLAEGDGVVVAAPAAKELVNTRGHVRWIGDLLVGVDLDPHDLRRVYRSEVDASCSETQCFPRHCLELAVTSSWRRRLDRWRWRRRQKAQKEVEELRIPL